MFHSGWGDTNNMPCSVKIELARGFQLSCSCGIAKVIGLKPRALIGILALENFNAIGRDQLASLLNSETNQSNSNTNFRQILRRTRRALGTHADHLLAYDADAIRLRQEYVCIDLIDAQAHAAAGQVPDLVSADPSAFVDAMIGFDDVDPSFANWIALKRQRMQQDMLNALTQSLTVFAPADERGIKIARVLLRMEPTHESAVRYLMMSHQIRGETSAALELYNALWRVLEDTYDALPSEQTQRLVVELKAEPSPIANPTESSVSLEPIQAYSSRQTNEFPTVSPNGRGRTAYLATVPIIWISEFSTTLNEPTYKRILEGFKIDFTAALCRFREWQVIGNNEVSLDVSNGSPGQYFVLSGTCIGGATGGEIVVTFQDLATKQIVWSERLSLGSTNWYRMQRRAIRRIALAMNLHLASIRIEKFQEIRDTELEYSEAWLLGQALLSDWLPESEDRAEALFRNLLQNQPDFAPAHTGLAQVLNARHHIRPGIYRSRSIHHEALTLSYRAVTIDPLDSRSQLTLAWGHAMTGNWDVALTTFRIASELNENDPWTLVSSALGFAYCGDQTAANEMSEYLTEIGLGISPLQWAYHAGVRFMEGDYEASVRAAEQGAGSTPYIAGWHAAALAHLGKCDKATQVLDNFFYETRSRWIGSDPPSKAAITKWLLHCYPIRGTNDWQCLRNGLELAGSPVPQNPPGIHA